MASQLHQAVELAQAGRRDEARQLLWQYLQTQPQNEVAWLWLATVAADQAEYLRALQEVLRINPGNQQAQQAVAQFQQQYGQFQRPSSPSPAPYGAPQVSTPPPVSYGTPSQAQQVPPPSYPGAPPVPPPEHRGYGAPLSPAQQPMQVQVRTVEKRRGCLGCSLPGCFGCLGCGGCWQGCLVALLVIVVLPAVACGALSYTNRSLGPFDWPASYLPGEFGRKTVTFTADTYDVTLKVPRSWYLVSESDQMWQVWRDMLDQMIPFENTNTTWATIPSSTAQPTILETNPIVLTEGGSQIGLVYNRTAAGNYQCSAIRSQASQYDSVTAYAGGLCGYSTHDLSAGPGQRVFKGTDAPAQVRLITFFVPVDQGTATRWQISLPEKEYGSFKADITATIDSVEIRTK